MDQVASALAWTGLQSGRACDGSGNHLVVAADVTVGAGDGSPGFRRRDADGDDRQLSRLATGDFRVSLGPRVRPDRRRVTAADLRTNRHSVWALLERRDDSRLVD